MPADRLITVNLTGEGMRNQYGEYVEGEVTPIRTWTRRRDKTQEDIESEGGVLTSVQRTWRIRWDSRIADVPVVRIEVVDGPYTFNVLNQVEVTEQRGGPDLRRRFIDIEGVYTS